MNKSIRLLSLLTIVLAAAATTPPKATAAVLGRADVDTSRRSGAENECAIAINPANRLQVFMACNVESATGLYAARSVNGGIAWTYPDPVDKTIADGDAGQGPSACCDPTLAWDRFGNLYITYISAALNSIETIRSADGGLTFTNLASFPGSVDQPTVVAASTTAPGAPVAVWVVWNDGSMKASGAKVTGLGAIGAFGAPQTIPGTVGCSFGDIAIARTGAVVQTCQNPTGGQGPATIFTNTDPDGLGPANFGAAVTVTTTNVGGFDFIPAQNSRSVDAEAGLAFDRLVGSPHLGRLYLVYTEEVVNESNDMNIMVRFSDNNGATWSAPIKVNDDPAVPIRSQFLPRISVDPRTAKIAVCWHDARNSATNTAMAVYCSIATNVGATPVFAPNAKVGDLLSTSNGVGVEFGDYAGLDYYLGVAYPAWADTSNRGGVNPDATRNFDAMMDRVTGP